MFKRITAISIVALATGCSQKPAESPPPAPPVAATEPSKLNSGGDSATGQQTPAIEGKWEIVSLLKNGVESVPTGGPITIEFRNGRRVMSQRGAVIDDVAYEFDASVTPHRLDTIHRNNFRNEGLATFSRSAWAADIPGLRSCNRRPITT